MLRKLLPITVLLLSLPTFAQASKVKVWHQHTPAHYERAHFRQAVISNEGALRLSRQLKPLAGIDATHVWDVIEDKAGNLLVATGNDGKIFKLSPDGKVSVAFAGEDSEILCLALGKDGSVYAGTGPGGLILRISPQGSGEVLYRTGEGYVWSLAVDATGQTVYAGTGPKGRIYQIQADGKGQLFYSTKQEHILALAMGPSGLLYAGTDKDGLIYRIDAKGKGFVLYSTPQTEVRSLLVTSDGDVYAGTSSPLRRRGLSGGGSGSHASSTPGLSLSTVGVATKAKTSTDKTDAASSSTGHASADDSSDRLSSTASTPPPSSGENSLYRIASDGTVRELFRERTMLLSLLRQDGRILIGTGMEGQLFEVEEATRERSEIARLDHGQIHCLCRRQDGSIILGTGDPGKLYVLQDKFAARGTVLSDVLDAHLLSKWGSLHWRADLPAGTSVTVAVRSGNTAEPNETWSDWSAEQTDAEKAAILAPTARFLQYRITLKTDDPQETPVVHSVALRYMTTNQAPEVTSIQVPDLDAVNLDNPKKLKFKWTATDPNEDDLTYSLYIRKEGWKNWVELEDDLEHAEYEWDTTTTPAGIYQIKVVASDRNDNSAVEALTGQRVSGRFAVAHEAPTVTIKTAGMDGNKAILEANATDPLVRLTSASFAVNGKKWVNVFPTDGLFDSKTESFRFKTDDLKSGSYVVVLRVKDAAGNTGSADVVFTVPAKTAKMAKR
jgi:hypothetical protein